MNVFVYGSLKPGGWSHGNLGDGVVHDPKEGTVEGALYDINGSWPALNINEPGVTHGLVYEVIDDQEEALMKRLDSLEGYPNLFDRKLMPIRVDNRLVEATVYFGVSPGLFDNAKIVESGVWDAV